MGQPPPTPEWLLLWADFAHNLIDTSGRRGFGTFAVGAVGKETILSVELVMGVNSSAKFDEVKIFAESNIPPTVRNHLEFKNFIMTKEPFHAETSIVLWAKDNNYKVFVIASSRQVCETCNGLLLDYCPDAQVVDGWKDSSGNILTQEQRAQIRGPGFTNSWQNLTAIRMAPGQ